MNACASVCVCARARAHANFHLKSWQGKSCVAFKPWLSTRLTRCLRTFTHMHTCTCMRTHTYTHTQAMSVLTRIPAPSRNDRASNTLRTRQVSDKAHNSRRSRQGSVVFSLLTFSLSFCLLFHSYHYSAHHPRFLRHKRVLVQKLASPGRTQLTYMCVCAQQVPRPSANAHHTKRSHSLICFV